MNLVIEKQKLGTSVGDHVYEIIKKNIINFNMPPGSRVSEKEVSDLLNVSRTPVREAFIKLSKEQLIYAVPQKGTYISHIDLEAVEDARFIRECLEKTVISMATESFPEDLIYVLEGNFKRQKQAIKQKKFYDFLMLDEDFHRTIFVGVNKGSVWSYIEQINTHYKRVRMLTLIADVNWLGLVDQHMHILKSIKNQDHELGQEVISTHIKKLITEQEELKTRYPQYFKID